MSDFDKNNVFWVNDEPRNFGDYLTPYLFNKITGRDAKYCNVDRDASENKLIMVGSILDCARGDAAVVWGTGTNWGSRLDGPYPLNPKCDIRAVRGPITRKVAISKGLNCPDVYGDPALLLPRYYSGKKTNDFVLGVIPHVVDYNLVVSNWQGRSPDQVKIIDLTKEIEEVIDDILQCDHIISSALHGLIVSDAYGIPSYWVEFSRNVQGDYTKFFDYFESVGIRKYYPMGMDPNNVGPENFDFRLFDSLDIKLDLDLLLEVFPKEYL